MSSLRAARGFGLLPGTPNQHFRPLPAFKSSKSTIHSRRSFKPGARAQKTHAMPLPPRQKVRTGVICSATDEEQGCSLIGGRGQERAHDRRGATAAPLGFDAVTAQSIFQAEKMTLGTAGSPDGFL